MPSILIVEDNPMNRTLFEKIFFKEGWNVTVSVNGRDAVDQWESSGGNFDLILMDVQMPVMDGYEATRVIRGMSRVGGDRVPIVAVTAHAMRGDRERCLDAGMNEYLTKPIHKHILVKVCQDLVGTPS